MGWGIQVLPVMHFLKIRHETRDAATEGSPSGILEELVVVGIELAITGKSFELLAIPNPNGIA